MITAIMAIGDALGYSDDEISRIMAACDTTPDGSKWSEASHNQLILTAAYVGKAVI